MKHKLKDIPGGTQFYYDDGWGEGRLRYIRCEGSYSTSHGHIITVVRMDNGELLDHDGSLEVEVCEDSVNP